MYVSSTRRQVLFLRSGWKQIIIIIEYNIILYYFLENWILNEEEEWYVPVLIVKIYRNKRFTYVCWNFSRYLYFFVNECCDLMKKVCLIYKFSYSIFEAWIISTSVNFLFLKSWNYWKKNVQLVKNVKMEAKKLAHYFSLLEIISLIIGGSVMACYLLNRSLLILICITLGWLLVIFFENMALSFNSHSLLVIFGLLRIFIMTGFCIGR